MHKLVIIQSHGVTVIDGTPVHCLSAMATQHDYIAMYYYDERGVMVTSKFWEGVVTIKAA